MFNGEQEWIFETYKSVIQLLDPPVKGVVNQVIVIVLPLLSKRSKVPKE